MPSEFRYLNAHYCLRVQSERDKKPTEESFEAGAAIVTAAHE